MGNEYRVIYPQRIVVANDSIAIQDIRQDGGGNTFPFYVTGAVSTGPIYELRKSRGTFTSPTIITVGDDLGTFNFYGYDGSAWNLAAAIEADTEGTIAATRIPGRLVFRTGTDATPTVMTEAGRINSSQIWIYGRGELGTVAATGNTLRSPNITTGGAGNIAGTTLTIAAGLGTGTGTRGSLIFQTPQVALVGDILQTLSTILTLQDLTATFAATSTITSGIINATVQSATAFTVARTGTTYAFQVDTSNAASVTGLAIVASSSGSGVNLQVISSAANDHIQITPKGSSGVVGLGGVSTRTYFAIGGVGTVAFVSAAPANATENTGIHVRFSSITAPTGNTGVITSLFFQGDSLVTTDGAHTVAATAYIQPPAITVGGAGSVTNGTALYVSGPSTGATTQNSSIFIDSGVSRFDGDLLLGSKVTGTITLTTVDQANVTLTIPSVGGARTFAFLQEAQTFSGALTLTTSPLNFTAGAQFIIGTTDAFGLMIKTGNVNRWLFNNNNTITAQAAADIIGQLNTASMIRLTDGTTALLSLDSRNTITGVTSALFSPSPPTIASAAGVTYINTGIAAFTVVLTGIAVVTAMNGIQLNIAQPTLSRGTTEAVTTASTVYIAGAPIAGGVGPITITNPYSLHIAAGRVREDGGLLIGGEPSGIAATVGYSNTVDNTANSTGTGTILFKGATNRNSSGFLKILDGTTARFIPYFDAITG